MLGMTPTKYRAGGRDEELRFAVGKTSLGALLAASSEKGVAAILLGDDPESLVRSLQDARLVPVVLPLLPGSPDGWRGRTPDRPLEGHAPPSRPITPRMRTR